MKKRMDEIDECECSLQEECDCNVKPKGYCGVVTEADWAVIHEMECQFPSMPIGCHWIQKCPAAL
jgi:hypothetical protein